MRESGVTEKYFTPVQDMYESITPVLRCAVGVTGGLKVEVELPQGSAPGAPSCFLLGDGQTDT